MIPIAAPGSTARRWQPLHSVRPTAPVPYPENAIEAAGLAKTYPKAVRPALDSVDLAIPRGSLFGLLGPNGAGKSTFINILAGLVVRSGGTARVWGHDVAAEPRAARSAIGVVPQELNLDTFFSPREMLELQAGLYGVPKAARRTDALLAAMGLADKADAYARTLSGGMRRRLLIAKAMVHSPPVLVLDEPTAGVDVELRRGLWAYVRDLNAAGATVLLTTHYLEEAQALCDRIAIIDHGRVVACDTTPALLRRLDSKELRLTLADEPGALPPSLSRFEPERTGPRELLFRYRPSVTRIADLLEAARAAGLVIADVSTRESDLEDIFLALTQPAEASAGGRRARRAEDG